MRDQPRTARVAGSRELRRGRARGAGAAPPAPDASPPLRAQLSARPGRPTRGRGRGGAAVTGSGSARGARWDDVSTTLDAAARGAGPGTDSRRPGAPRGDPRPGERQRPGSAHARC